MKRSEMLRIIENFVHDLDNTDEDYMIINPNEFCKNLLLLIEKAGMLPPHIYGFENDEEVQSYEWEPEDE